MRIAATLVTGLRPPVPAGVVRFVIVAALGAAVALVILASLGLLPPADPVVVAAPFRWAT